MYRLRKLTVRQFRGLNGKASFEFGDRYHLVVGTNGGGKTNLLRLVAMVTQLDFSALSGESFDVSWEGAWDTGGRIDGQVRRVQARPTTMAHVGRGAEPHSPSRASWNWSVTLTFPGVKPITLSARRQGGLSGGEGDPTNLGGSSIQMPLVMKLFDDDSDAAVRFFEAFGFRAAESLESFAALVEPGSHSPDSLGTPAFEPRVLATEGQEPSAGGFGLDEGAKSWASVVAAGQTASLRGDQLAWIDAVRRDLSAADIAIEPSLREKETTPRSSSQPEVTEFRFSGCNLLLRLSPRLQVHHDLLSYGQKRLIGLRYHLATSPEAPAIIDELSNGLHHGWVESLIRDLEGRQSFLATQNPLVMDHVWWENADECGRGIIICKQDSDHRWRWRQLGGGEGLRFHQAWTAGVQHVHEVLMTEGWW